MWAAPTTCLLAVASLLAAGGARAEPKSFLLSDDVVGPTCANYLTMGAYAWNRKGGDWVDAAGALYGGKAYDTQPVARGRGRPFVEWDVTGLVQGWLDNRFPNTGMMLRAEPGGGGGPVDFHSRESLDASAHPMLKLQWADGTQARLPAAADSFLDCSSLSSLGSAKEIKVGSGQGGFLRFALPKPPATLKKATLYLTSDVQYGNGATVGVYRLAPPYARVGGPARQGLAQAYPMDAGIEQNREVIFATGFEKFAWIAEWSEFGIRSNAETISEDPERRFEALSGKALRVRLVKGSNFGLDLRYNFAGKTGSEPEEVYFRYYLRFANDWNPYLDGGKMPGISGTNGKAGWGMRKADGFNGWSLRGGFAPRPSMAKTVAGMTSLVSYAYHADQQESSGDIWSWGDGPSALVENNRWYCIEQYVKLNTPGAKDGIVRAWVDGYQVMEKKDVRFRNTPTLKINSIWLDVYHGGVSLAPENMALYIDNVVVARSYIGPMRR
jgi:hypothetical protein